jgi:hypothetical protein
MAPPCYRELSGVRPLENNRGQPSINWPPEVTQAELAASLGVSQARASKIEHGENSGIDVVRAYLHALGGHLDVIASIGDQTWRPA